MKRFSIGECVLELRNGAFVRDWAFFTINAGCKVTRGDDIIGYITFSQLMRLVKAGLVTRRPSYSYDDYTPNYNQIRNVIVSPIDANELGIVKSYIKACERGCK